MSNFIFLGKPDWNDPLYRMYFETLVLELRKRNYQVDLVEPEHGLFIPDCPDKTTIVNFFYKDIDSIKLLKQVSNKRILKLCFTSDIESYQAYAEAYTVADAFLCPSPLHKKMLDHVFALPSYLLREAIDPIVAANPGSTLIRNYAKKIVWFGFPESYRRSMPILEPIISEALAKRNIDSFSVISGYGLKKDLPAEFIFLEYQSHMLMSELGKFNYALLSHLPLDAHINTFIKSPNKAISAIMSGVIPITSTTPNYEVVLRSAGLKRYLFDSPQTLLNIFGRLSRDGEASYQEDINIAQESIQNHYSSENQCVEYLNSIDDLNKKILQDDFFKTKVSLKFFEEPEEEIKLRFYYRQQFKKLKKFFSKMFSK